MSYQHTMSTGAIIVAGALLAFSDGSRANDIQENSKFRLIKDSQNRHAIEYLRSCASDTSSACSQTQSPQ